MTVERYREIIRTLRDLIKNTPWEGNVYCVGGCCRDELTGTDIHDIDLAITVPDGGIKFAEWLQKKRLLGAPPVKYPKFGTAMVVLKKYPDLDLELVQTRSEKYTDHNSRNPETAYGTLEQDCLRRDFTINSLYYDISRDACIDITGRGRQDIADRIIRTPVDPDATFDDDPVRILRCVRFAARFGWEIDSPTFDALRRNVRRLSIVSANRMRNEVERMLVGPDPRGALEMLREIGAMEYVMPELIPLFTLRQPGTPPWTVWQHTLQTVEMIDPEPALRFAALFHDLGKAVTDTNNTKSGKSILFDQHESSGAKLAKQILHRFHAPSQLSRDVVYFVVNHMACRSFGDQGQFIKDKKLRKLQYLSRSRHRFEKLLQLIHVDNLAQHYPYCMPAQVPAVQRHIERMDVDGTSMYHYSLPVTHEDIRRVKGQISDRQLRRCEDYLLRLAFENTRLTARELLKKLRQYDIRSLADKPSNRRRKSSKKHKMCG